MRVILFSLLLLWICRCPCIMCESRPYVPQYMLDLYYGRNTSSAFNTVRSYSNVFGDLYDDYDYDVLQSPRQHILGFNLSTTLENERVHLAELRLYTKIGNYDENVEKNQIQLSIFDISASGQRKLIASRPILGFVDSWETFNVTEAVSNWLIHPDEDHRLEVYLEGDTRMNIDVSVVPHQNKEPLLLVYTLTEKKSMEDGMLKRMRRSFNTHLIEKRSEEEDEEQEELTNYIIEELGKKVTKKGKVRRRKNPCRRKPLKIHFGDINYDKWIVAPESYEAFECTGKCHFPMSAHLTPTKHAIIQTILHQANPKAASRACCVPTKLGSISVLYVAEDGSVIYNYSYEDMVVEECGCR